MTHEEAYIEGFCKAAEAAGVDPVALYKQAQLKTQLLGMLGRAGGRLLGAGRAAAGAASAGGKRYLELLRGGRPTFLDQMRKGIGVEHLNSPIERLRTAMKGRAGRLMGGAGQNAEDVLEARKALAAQLGTAGAGGAGIYGLMRGRQAAPAAQAAPAGDNTQQQA